MWDVAVIGAGLSGLVCARALKKAGHQVCVLDKSRGLGGRIATRRVDNDQAAVRVDHGLRYWTSAPVLAPLVDELVAANVLKSWEVSAYEILQREVITPAVLSEKWPLYVAPKGMNAVGKYLAQDFTREQDLLLEHRAIAIDPKEGNWRIECEGGQIVMAKRCAIAIPAPQAAHLLKTYAAASLSDPSAPISQAVQALKSVDYWPSLTVMAGYDEKYSNDMGELDPNGWMVTDKAGTSTEWVGLDSSKREQSEGPVIVIHSQGTFAQRYIDAGDLQPAASVLLRASARKFSAWIAQPDWFQIHRWRYAFVNIGYADAALEIEPSLICGGDWCVGNDQKVKNIEAAYLSGLAMAEKLSATI